MKKISLKHVIRIIATVVSIATIAMFVIAFVYIWKIFKFNNFPRGEIITSFGGFYDTRFDNGWEIERIGNDIPETCNMIYQQKRDMEKDSYNERITELYMKIMNDTYGDDHVVVLYYK